MTIRRPRARGSLLIDRPSMQAIEDIDRTLRDCHRYVLEILRNPPSQGGSQVGAAMRQQRRHALRQIASIIAIWQRDDTEGDSDAV